MARAPHRAGRHRPAPRSAARGHSSHTRGCVRTRHCLRRRGGAGTRGAGRGRRQRRCGQSQRGAGRRPPSCFLLPASCFLLPLGSAARRGVAVPRGGGRPGQEAPAGGKREAARSPPPAMPSRCCRPLAGQGSPRRAARCRAAPGASPSRAVSSLRRDLGAARPSLAAPAAPAYLWCSVSPITKRLRCLT